MGKQEGWNGQNEGAKAIEERPILKREQRSRQRKEKKDKEDRSAIIKDNTIFAVANVYLSV